MASFPQDALMQDGAFWVEVWKEEAGQCLALLDQGTRGQSEVCAVRRAETRLTWSGCAKSSDCCCSPLALHFPFS